LDEVGRGCWAGPVMAAAVVLPPAQVPSGINDSKKLSRAARDAVRRRIAPLADDRYLKPDLDAALALAEDGSVVAAAEAAAGTLG